MNKLLPYVVQPNLARDIVCRLKHVNADALSYLFFLFTGGHVILQPAGDQV